VKKADVFIIDSKSLSWKYSNGAKKLPSRVRKWNCRKWIDLDEIWNSVCQMLGAGSGRFWARSA